MMTRKDYRAVAECIGALLALGNLQDSEQADSYIRTLCVHMKGDNTMFKRETFYRAIWEAQEKVR